MTPFKTRPFLRNILASCALAAFCAATLPAQGLASGPDHVAVASAYFEEKVAPWLSAPQIIEAIKAQNARTAGLTQAEIDRLDQQWRSETQTTKHTGPLIESLMKKPVSVFVRDAFANTSFTIVEVIIMDARGLNVGISTPTSDYWQGDEAKYQKTFQTGSRALFVDDLEFNSDVGLILAQVNRTIFDPQTGQPIGAVTIGMNFNQL